MRVLMIALVLAFALVGAGCGGDDEEGAGDTTTVEVVTDETTDDTTDGSTDPDVDIGDFVSGECQELVEASQALSAAFAAAGSGTENLDETSALFEEFAESAPEEIRADIAVLADAYAKYAEAFADIDIQAGETPDAETLAAIQQALSSIDQAEVTAASQRLSTWTTENC